MKKIIVTFFEESLSEKMVCMQIENNNENKNMSDIMNTNDTNTKENTNTTEYYIDADNLSIEEVLAFGYEEWLKEEGKKITGNRND